MNFLANPILARYEYRDTSPLYTSVPAAFLKVQGITQDIASEYSHFH